MHGTVQKCFFFISSILMVSFISCNQLKKERNLKLNEEAIDIRANQYYWQNEYLLAKEAYDTLIFINSTKADYYFRRAYCKTMLLNDDKSAITDYYQAINYGYKNIKAAYVNIGTIYRSHHMYDSALFYYDKALDLDTNYDKAKIEKNEVLNLLKNIQ